MEGNYDMSRTGQELGGWETAREAGSVQRKVGHFAKLPGLHIGGSLALVKSGCVHS